MKNKDKTLNLKASKLLQSLGIEWRNVKGYEGLYQVSNMGDIKRLSTVLNYNIFGKKPFKMYKKGRVMKVGLGSNGYKNLTLSKRNKKTQHSLHRLVAEAFVENTDDLPTVNHKNMNKLDNRAENLEWMSVGDNVRHSVFNGVGADNRGEKNHFSKLKIQDVCEIRNSTYDINELAEIKQVSPQTIRDIIAKRRWGWLDCSTQ